MTNEYEFGVVVRRAKDGINGKLYRGVPMVSYTTIFVPQYHRYPRERIEQDYRARYGVEHLEYLAGKSEFKGRVNPEPSQKEVDWWCDFPHHTSYHYETVGVDHITIPRVAGVFISDHGIHQCLLDGHYTIVDMFPINREFDFGKPVGNEVW